MALPSSRLSASRGRALGIGLPPGASTRDDFLRRSPSETWGALCSSSTTLGLTDGQVWDLVAHQWRTTTTDAALREGVEASFVLTDVGDQPLELAQAPYIDVIEGC